MMGIENYGEFSRLSELVGRVKAPKGTGGYCFITQDTERVKIGEFVYYEVVDEAGKNRRVLGRTTSRASIRDYPVSYLSLKEVRPEEILRATGIGGHNPLFEVEVSILGYFDKGFKFVNPRIPPLQGTEVYLASDDYLEEVLGKGGREQGKALIGHLLNRPGQRVPISLDVRELVSKHLAVLAATGSGKSYAVGVLLEELMGRYNKAAVLVLDPHGEYSTMDEMRNWRDNPLVEEGYAPDVKVLSEEDIKIRYSDLEASDWAGILKDASDKMLNLLHESLQRLKGHGRFSLSDIIAELEAQKDDTNESSVNGLHWRLRAHARKRIFSPGEYTPLTDILRPGLLTIIDMSELEEGDQQLIASILLRRILRARIRTKKEKISEGEYYLPYPVFVVLEEAHRFAPGSGESRAKRVLKTILSEGRKFDVGTCLVSQRPGKLDSDVLSQCMTQIIMKITNPSDQENIKQSVEAVTADLMDELPSLTTGQAVVVGAAINTPVTVRVRERFTTPGGTSGNAPKEWQEFYLTRALREKRDTAPLVRKRDEGLF
ncbi:MAG: ATP-binding protein [Thermoplasmata archaeon]|nr:ATP-binding protein [Thermoplasmata archaeon]